MRNSRFAPKQYVGMYPHSGERQTNVGGQFGILARSNARASREENSTRTSDYISEGETREAYTI